MMPNVVVGAYAHSYGLGNYPQVKRLRPGKWALWRAENDVKGSPDLVGYCTSSVVRPLVFSVTPRLHVGASE